MSLNANGLLLGFELVLLRQMLAWRAWNFTTQSRKQSRYRRSRNKLCHDHEPTFWKRSTSLVVSKANLIKVKKSEVNRANIFCRKKLKQKGAWPSKTSFLQGPTSDVVSVLPCSPTNKGKQNIIIIIYRIFVAVRKKLAVAALRSYSSRSNCVRWDISSEWTMLACSVNCYMESLRLASESKAAHASGARTLWRGTFNGAASSWKK